MTDDVIGDIIKYRRELARVKERLGRSAAGGAAPVPSLHMAEEARSMRDGANIAGRVASVAGDRTILKGAVRVRDVWLEDASGGRIKLTLWPEDAGRVGVGAEIAITGGRTEEIGEEICLSRGSGRLDIVSGAG